MAARKNAKDGGPQAKRKKTGNKYQMPEPISLGTIITDSQKGQWKIGPSIGSGGFGEIYAAYSLAAPVPRQFALYPYVVKIEPHENGPLFVEKNFYMKYCRPDDLEKYRKRFKLKHLAIPNFVSSGSHDVNGIKHRFLIIPRYGESLQSVLLRYGKCLPLEAVYRIALQMLDVLEYIHMCGYVHADLKAANILFADGAYDRVYLVDFGLATKYDVQEVFKPDARKKHNGTIEYTSRDAHQGVSTIRGDLEVLAYNLIEWAGGKLPWNEEKTLKDCNKVHHMKEASIGDGTPTDFLKRCFPKSKTPPKPLADFIQLVVDLAHNAKPKYTSCSQLFEKALKQLGVSKSGGMGLAGHNLSPSSPSTSGPLVLAAKVDKRKKITATPKQAALPDTVPNTPEISPSTSIRTTRRTTQSELNATVSSIEEMPDGTYSKSLSGINVQIGTSTKSSQSRSGLLTDANFSPRVILVKINIDSNVNLNIETPSNKARKRTTSTITPPKGRAASTTKGRTTKQRSNRRNMPETSISASDDDIITFNVSDTSDEGNISKSVFD
ncbi:nucleosomal histone kinase 1-like [Anopheles darlingi]|uniref:nucleosomal histone kinase 1-like n=1 Tax=Anopheles darlingi TaxID=43151 RepID=UPI0020FFFD04|nr:nucleosomal histone kinase 1-like [Anopheles darlingi]